MQHNKGRYSVHADETVSVAAAGTSAPADAVVSFSSFEELKALTSQWPMRQLVSVWNKLPGTRRVTRFENRSIATERLWRALDQQSPAAIQKSAPKKERTVRQTKAECIVALLQAPEGATLEALMKATGWQAHSVRGFLSRKVSKEPGLQLDSLRRDGKRVYRLPAPVCAQAE